MRTAHGGWAAGMLGVAVVGAGIGGCASPTPATPVEPAAVVQGRAMAPASLVWDGPERSSYRAMGEEPGTLEVERAPGDAGMTRVTERISMGEGAISEREVLVRVRDDGGVEMVREINHAEKVIVDFEPALLVYPALLAPGESVEQRLRMVVHPMRNPERVQAQGDVVHTIRFEGVESIETGTHGTVEGWKLVSVLQADLGGPQVVNESQEWFAPGLGIVARKKMERTTLLGMRVRANNEWWVQQ